MANQYRRNTRTYPQPDNWRSLPDGEMIKTCPASRHAAMICDDILRDSRSPVRRLLIDAGYEPDHWAASIECVVQSLWEARRYMEWESLPPTKRYRLSNGHWVPIAQGIVARSDETTEELAQPGGQEPGGEAMRPDPVSTPQQHQER